jgi:cell division protein FtsQ
MKGMFNIKSHRFPGTMEKGSKRGRKTVWSKIKKGGILYVIHSIAVSGIIAGRMLYKAFPSVFPLREIMILGNRHLTEGEVKSLARLRSGEGLLRVSGKNIADNLLKSPWIKTATVRKDFPDRLRIRIYESSPFAILELKGQAFFIDETGRILEKMKGETVSFLPVITGDPSKRRASYMEALNLVRVLKKRNIAAERGRVEIMANVEGPEELSVVFDGMVVKIGNGDYDQKLDRIADLEEEIRKRVLAVEYIDVRFADKVIMKPVARKLH